MDVTVLETQDGALVLVDTHAALAAEILQLGALHCLGHGNAPVAALSDELVSALSRDGVGVAQPGDVATVLRLVCTRSGVQMACDL